MLWKLYQGVLKTVPNCTHYTSDASFHNFGFFFKIFLLEHNTGQGILTYSRHLRENTQWCSFPEKKLLEIHPVNRLSLKNQYLIRCSICSSTTKKVYKRCADQQSYEVSNAYSLLLDLHLLRTFITYLPKTFFPHNFMPVYVISGGCAQL